MWKALGPYGHGQTLRTRRTSEHSIERDDDDARGLQGEGTREVDRVHAAQAVSMCERRSEARHRPVATSDVTADHSSSS